MGFQTRKRKGQKCIYTLSHSQNGDHVQKSTDPAQKPQRLTPQQNRFETLIRLFGDDARELSRELSLWSFAPDEMQAAKVLFAFLRLHLERSTITDAPDHEDAPPPPPPPPPRKQDRPRPQDWHALYKPLEGEKGGREKW